jgi:D-alanine-D-alanine ligase-like ATP-grasp enzyme
MMPPFSAMRRPSVVLGGIPGVWRELATRARLASETGIRHQLVRISQDVRHAYGERVHATAAEEMWQTAARACGAEVRNRSGDVLEITRNGLRTRVWGQTVPLNDEVAVHFAGDRFRLFAVLEEAGIPVPEFLGFRMRELGDAIEFLERGPVPCVIKPAQSSSGFGVTAQLREPKDDRLAACWAARFGDRLLIERQGEGAVFRLLVLDNVLIDAVRRHPPRITGDGCSTIARLVDREYERRLRLRANARGSRSIRSRFHSSSTSTRSLRYASRVYRRAQCWRAGAGFGSRQCRIRTVSTTTRRL